LAVKKFHLGGRVLKTALAVALAVSLAQTFGMEWMTLEI